VKKINIKGPIISNDDKWIYDFLGMDSTSPDDVANEFPDDASDVEIIINSGGGDVYAGSEIYTELRSYEGNVTVKIVGLAASAASVIAMAGDDVQISPTAHIMIHNVSSITQGDHEEHEKSTSILTSHDKSIANAYVFKTGKSQDELLGLMDDETWMDADMAVENGFADEVMFQEDSTPQLVASAQTPVLPKEAVDKLRAFNQQSNNEEVGTEKIETIVNQAVDNAMSEYVAGLNEEQDEPKDEEPRNKETFLNNLTKNFSQIQKGEN